MAELACAPPPPGYRPVDAHASFDLGNFLNLIEADNLVEIRAVDGNDGGVLGFIKLIVQTDAGGTGNPVPEPASLALVGAALSAALMARRRRPAGH